MANSKKPLLYAGLGYSLMLFALPANAYTSILELLYSMQNEATAWAISVKQTSVSANQQASSAATSAQQLSTAIGAIGMSDRLMKSITSYDSDSGQPMSIKCAAQQNGKLFVIADQQKLIDASHLMTTFASQRVSSQAVADDQRLSMHRDTYCSVSESKQGMCKLVPNGMQGWDVNYGGAFAEKTLAPEGEVAGYAYVAMVADNRADAHTACSTIACAAAQSEQLSESAMSSMAANSLVGQITSRRVPMLTGK